MDAVCRVPYHQIMAGIGFTPQMFLIVLTFLLAGHHRHLVVPILTAAHLDTVLAPFKCRVQRQLARALDYMTAGKLPAPVSRYIFRRAEIDRLCPAPDKKPVTVLHAAGSICRDGSRWYR